MLCVHINGAVLAAEIEGKIIVRIPLGICLPTSQLLYVIIIISVGWGRSSPTHAKCNLFLK